MIYVVDVFPWFFSKPALLIFIIQFANGPRNDDWARNTPSYEEKDPFPQLICGIGHHYSSMQVAAFHKHPEEVGHHKIIVDSGNAPTPGFIAFMYVVVYHLEQKPHHISQDERGD